MRLTINHVRDLGRLAEDTTGRKVYGYCSRPGDGTAHYVMHTSMTDVAFGVREACEFLLGVLEGAGVNVRAEQATRDIHNELLTSRQTPRQRDKRQEGVRWGTDHKRPAAPARVDCQHHHAGPLPCPDQTDSNH